MSTETTRIAAIEDTGDRFFGLPLFALGHIDRADMTANLEVLWERTTGSAPASDANAFIARLVDIIERQNNLSSVDTGEVVESTITMYEGIMNTTLFPGDPVRLFLSTLAAIIAMQNAVSDWTQKQNFLRFATGAYLDGLAALLDVYRLESFPAKTVIRYSLAAPRPVPTIIPQGTRSTADGKIFFATDALKVIPTGVLTVEIPATCLTHGLEGNGLIPGLINRAVDVIAFVKSVENIIESNGGSDTEGDESLRARVRLSPGRTSTAGARLSYLYHALTAHGNIGDVSVVGPDDRNGERKGEVDIFVMLKGGGIPDANGAEISAVESALNQERVRPLTDKVNVHPVYKLDIDYTITWFITAAQGAQYTQIEEQIEAAVKEYETWQTERVGRDINPDRLVELCRAAGAKRVELDGLAFTPLTKNTVAYIDNREIISGGVEGE